MRPRFLQLLAAISLLLVWVATPLLSVAHLALEEHRYCVEHDRLEEGIHKGAQEDAALASKEAGESNTALGVVRNTNPREDRTHVDCAFHSDCIVTGDGLVGPSHLATLCDYGEMSALPVAMLAIRHGLIYRVAPKTSPPALSS